MTALISHVASQLLGGLWAGACPASFDTRDKLYLEFHANVIVFYEIGTVHIHVYLYLYSTQVSVLILIEYISRAMPLSI